MPYDTRAEHIKKYCCNNDNNSNVLQAGTKYHLMTHKRLLKGMLTYPKKKYICAKEGELDKFLPNWLLMLEVQLLILTGLYSKYLFLINKPGFLKNQIVKNCSTFTDYVMCIKLQGSYYEFLDSHPL